MYQWFALFDIRSEQKGEELACLLADEATVQFPDARLNSRKEFLDWYMERFPLVTRGYHEIHEIEVKLASEKRAKISLDVLLHAKLANGNEVEAKYRISAEATNFKSGSPKINSYTAIPVP